jgi:hypothetical protein
MWNLICQVRALFVLVDRDDRQQAGDRGGTDLTWGCPVGSGDVDQSFQQVGEGGLPVLDCRLLVVGERDVGQHALEVFLGLQELCLAGVLQGVEIPTGTSHPVWTLLEEAIGAVAVAEVVVLPRLPGRRRTGGDGVAGDEHFDGADVAGEVSGVAVGLRQGCRGDRGVMLSAEGLRWPSQAKPEARTASSAPSRCRAGWRWWIEPGGW